MCGRADKATASNVRRFVISFTHWTMQRKGAGIGEPTAPDGKVDDDPLCLGIHARETPEERSLRKRVFVRDDLPWCAAAMSVTVRLPTHRQHFAVLVPLLCTALACCWRVPVWLELASHACC